jgi:N-methylhydantoinase A
VICPPIPGAFSALGLIGTDLRRDYVQTLFTLADVAHSASEDARERAFPSEASGQRDNSMSARAGHSPKAGSSARATDPVTLEAAFVVLERKGAAMLDRAGIASGQRRFERCVDARYPRQSYELQVALPPRPVDRAMLQAIAATFHDRHLQTYGHANRDEPVQIVAVRLAAIGAIPPLVVRDQPAPAGTDAVKAKRRLWFRETGVVDAAIYDRRRMPAGLALAGPVVIESLESTILVPPGWHARMNEDGFVLLQRNANRKC